MEYNDNREVNEMKKRDNGQRDSINSSMLLNYLGSDNYQNKVEEMLLDVLNDNWNINDAIKDVQEHTL